MLATPAYEAANLVRLLRPSGDARSRRHPYAPIASVATVYPRSDIAHSLAGFGFLVPRREQRKILGCLFSSSMFDGRAPARNRSASRPSSAGHVVPSFQPDRTPKSRRSCMVIQALVGARGDPAWTAITRWTHAIPQYNLGHRERLRPVEDAERALPGLFFCASYRGGVSVGDRIQSAHAVADAVTRFLGGSA